jgi:DNA-directed RNA polymerase sigma subunit (sigma70/sigma32)
MKSYYEQQKEIPSEEVLAREVGDSVKRLRQALQYTRPLVSIDGPIGTGGGGLKGSRAGGDAAGDDDMMIKDTLQCMDPRPEDQVELSFLRQCLENAMAAELSPHERDILRLRLGLDDGVSRTAKDVTKVYGGNLSPAQVRSAEQRAYRKLRSPHMFSKYKFGAYVDFCDIDLDTVPQQFSPMTYGY